MSCADRRVPGAALLRALGRNAKEVQRQTLEVRHYVAPTAEDLAREQEVLDLLCERFTEVAAQGAPSEPAHRPLGTEASRLFRGREDTRIGITSSTPASCSLLVFSQTCSRLGLAGVAAVGCLPAWAGSPTGIRG